MEGNASNYIYQATLWIGVLCILLASVFLGLSVVQIDLRWAGILFICLAALDIMIFFILRYRIMKSGGDARPCGFITKFCSCCSGCKDVKNNELTSQTVGQRQGTRDASQSSRSDQDQDLIEIQSKLRSLERHIHTLFQEYTALESKGKNLTPSKSEEYRDFNIDRIHQKLALIQVGYTLWKRNI